MKRTDLSRRLFIGSTIAVTTGLAGCTDFGGGQDDGSDGGDGGEDGGGQDGQGGEEGENGEEEEDEDDE